MELTELDQEEIARLIAEGNTSGLLSDGEGNSMSWELNYNKWNDEEG